MPKPGAEFFTPAPPKSRLNEVVNAVHRSLDADKTFFEPVKPFDEAHEFGIVVSCHRQRCHSPVQWCIYHNRGSCVAGQRAVCREPATKRDWPEENPTSAVARPLIFYGGVRRFWAGNSPSKGAFFNDFVRTKLRGCHACAGIPRPSRWVLRRCGSGRSGRAERHQVVLRP